MCIPLETSAALSHRGSLHWEHLRFGILILPPPSSQLFGYWWGERGGDEINRNCLIFPDWFWASRSFTEGGKGVGIIFPLPLIFPLPILRRNRKSSFPSFLFGGGCVRFVVYPLNIQKIFFSKLPPDADTPALHAGGWYIPPASNLRVTRTNPIFRGLRIRALNRIPTQASSYAEVLLTKDWGAYRIFTSF